MSGSMCLPGGDCACCNTPDGICYECGAEAWEDHMHTSEAGDLLCEHCVVKCTACADAWLMPGHELCTECLEAVLGKCTSCKRYIYKDDAAEHASCLLALGAIEIIKEAA